MESLGPFLGLLLSALTRMSYGFLYCSNLFGQEVEGTQSWGEIITSISRHIKFILSQPGEEAQFRREIGINPDLSEGRSL